MSRWTCPQCDREFGRANQSHTCVPGGTVADTFSGRPAGQLEAYQHIMAHLATVGPVHVDSVQVGVFLKSDRKFAELRPMSRALSVNLQMSRSIADARVIRTQRITAEQYLNVVRVTDPDQVDEVLCGWFTEAYDEATD